MSVEPIAGAAAPLCHAAAVAAGSGPAIAVSILVIGLLSAVMPCTIQMSIVFGALLIRPSDWSGRTPGNAPSSARPLRGWPHRLLGFGGAYILTFAVAAAVVGTLVSVVGAAASARVVTLLGGVALIGIGLHTFGFVRLPGGGRCRGPVSFFLGQRFEREPAPGQLGAAFALYCAGCCGPSALAAAALIAHGSSSAVTAAFLLVYGAGMAIPFLGVAAALTFAVRPGSRVLRMAPGFAAAAGVFAVAMGTLTLFRAVAV